MPLRQGVNHQPRETLVVHSRTKRTGSRVRIASDFRDNLIIDRYDPLFVGMRASKQEHLKSANSEDAVTWNVFRSLRQIDASCWLPELAQIGIPGHPTPPLSAVAVLLWASLSPPPNLLVNGDEGDSEIDVLIEAPTWVWCVEAKLYSDISTGTTTRPLRDQVLRNIDVGSFHAGVRDFYFSLLIHSQTRAKLGLKAVRQYQDLVATRSALAGHRPDGLPNLRSVSVLTWADLARVLASAEAQARRPGERAYATRAIAWLKKKGLDVVAD